MRKLMLLAGAALLASAAPAAAQVLGGNVGGNVSGNVGVGVSRPDLGVRDTIRDTRDFGRDTVRSTRDALPGAFEELKKFEHVAETTRLNKLIAIAKRETAAFDELGLRKRAV